MCFQLPVFVDNILMPFLEPTQIFPLLSSIMVLATLLAREVSSATSVEILVTGVESGAQKRITVNITPGESVINTPVNGNRSPISSRARTRVSSEDRANVRPGVRERTQRAVANVRTQETARSVVQRAVRDGRAISAESLARELSR